MSNPPPIPEIGGDVDLLLDIYTHISLRHPSTTTTTGGSTRMNEEYGDTDRLAELGAHALELAVTKYLYSLRPFLTGRDIQDRGIGITSDVNIDMWLNAYRMKEKLRVAPSEAHVLDDPVEMRKYFYTFLGAVYIRNPGGLSTIQSWISALIDWSSQSSLGAGANVDGSHVVDVVDVVDGGVENPV